MVNVQVSAFCLLKTFFFFSPVLIYSYSTSVRATGKNKQLFETWGSGIPSRERQISNIYIFIHIYIYICFCVYTDTFLSSFEVLKKWINLHSIKIPTLQDRKIFPLQVYTDLHPKLLWKCTLRGFFPRPRGREGGREGWDAGAAPGFGAHPGPSAPEQGLWGMSTQS